MLEPIKPLGAIVDRHAPCPICDRWIGDRGQHSHYMAHVRRGEMTVENDPLDTELLRMGIAQRHAEYCRPVGPCIFRLVEPPNA